ncbi:MAG: DNA topoisomerase IV subunit A, partial [Alphaproteobacteria bacterium]|nr:DNA topoisomerase IV subunit A [Alphaproteobacteria bacterium]
VTEIPYLVQKSKLIERIADLIQTRKIPMLDDVRDESAEDVRLILIPKNRNIEPELLMEALYRSCDLESRFNMNLNVLESGKVPKVMNLKEALRNWLDHQQDVLIRRSQFQLEKLLKDIERLQGFMLIYLNVDKVIKIIRFDDHPKEKLIKTFKLTEYQAEEILNMRLRRLNKLQEIEIKKELEDKEKERDRLEKLIKSEARQWTHIKKQIGELKKKFGTDTPLGKRRTKIGKPPAPIAVNLNEAMIEKEPVTVICSDKGWIRGMKGHGHNPKDFKFKDGDRGRFNIEAQTTDKIVIFATNGRFYTLGCDKLPSARGFGEPVRLMVDIPNDADITGILVFQPGGKILVASTEGRGFIVPSDDVLAQTKSGKQILNVSGKTEAALCRYVEEGDDHIAVIGKNRKMLVFELAELPVMSRGKGVRLQKLKEGGLADAKTFNWVKGLTFKYGTGETLVGDLNPWVGARASAGRVPPNGFPKTNKFD